MKAPQVQSNLLENNSADDVDNDDNLVFVHFHIYFLLIVNSRTFSEIEDRAKGCQLELIVLSTVTARGCQKTQYLPIKVGTPIHRSSLVFNLSSQVSFISIRCATNIDVRNEMSHDQSDG